MSLDTLQRLYAGFAALDADAMQACYASAAQFDDEVFALQGPQAIGAMWRMLCTATQAQVARHGASAWQLQASALRAEGGRGSARWEVHYRFPATGRSVHNRIAAAFTFDAEGLILRHHDRFDFWAWSRQALGVPGWLAGWSPWLRHKVRRQAARSLQRFIEADDAARR